MKIAIKVAAAALMVLASAPAFAHGGGMGHMGGNMGASMGANTGKTSQQTVIGKHDGDHHMQWRYTKTIGKTHTHLKTLTVQRVVRVKQEIERLKLEIIKLRAEGRGNSFLAHRLLYREMALAKLINV